MTKDRGPDPRPEDEREPGGGVYAGCVNAVLILAALAAFLYVLGLAFGWWATP